MVNKGNGTGIQIHFDLMLIGTIIIVIGKETTSSGNNKSDNIMYKLMLGKLIIPLINYMKKIE